MRMIACDVARSGPDSPSSKSLPLIASTWVRICSLSAIVVPSSSMTGNLPLGDLRGSEVTLRSNGRPEAFSMHQAFMQNGLAEGSSKALG